MTTQLLFALGTLLSWTGWIAAVRALYLGLQLVLGAPGSDRTKTARGLMLSAGLAAAAFLVALALPMETKQATDGWRLPLVWFVMPFTAWAVVASAGMTILRAVQGWLALNAEQRLEKLKASGIWAAVGVVFLVLYKRDPDVKIEVLTGGVTISPIVVAALALLAVATLVAMVLAGRAVRSRGYAKAVAIHAALLIGSIFFGMPFAWLVITSFKEDRDMASPNGIVWIPKVQEEVEYLDKKDPLYEGRFQDRTVQATVLEKLPDGRTRFDIIKPAAMRGLTFEAPLSQFKEVPKLIPIVSGKIDGTTIKGKVVEEMDDGHRRVEVMEPASLKGRTHVFEPAEVEPVRNVGLRTRNYTDALEFLPPETNMGLVYLKNTLILVVLGVAGTLLSSSIVAYAFSRMRFPGRNVLFTILLSTMMLPGAVTMLPQFLIFRSLGWIDTLYPLWVPAFFASAFNVFLLRQFFMQIPMELEDASKIDGASYLKTFWSVMLPQIKPALAVIAIWTFMGAWNNFMGPLIYINSPENMPIAYAVQLFQGDRGGEPGLMMAFATMSMLPVLLLFFFAQKYFIEGVTLSGMGGR
ncbi:MAG TPA: carbohydrate ABC transporter permease [Fimbriimonas sp.]